MDLVVGVDLATAAVRAVAADAGGHVHGRCQAPLPPPTSPQAGWCEQDATAWWPATASVLRRLVRDLGSASSRVAALSVCATSGTVVAVNRAGEPSGPALTYADQRAVKEADEAQAAGSRRWETLGLRIQPSFGLAKWGWLVRHGFGGSAVGLAHASDVVVTSLLGRPAPTDWSHALKSGFDPLGGEWAGEALAALGIDPGQVPEALAPTSLVGSLSAAAAGATGLPGGCQVRLGMTDSCASQLAAGAGAPGAFVSVLGTTLVLKGVSSALVADPSGAVYSHRHPSGWWLPGGASSTGGAALRSAFAGRDLPALDQAAMAHGPAAGVAYPLVGRGERFPFVAPDAEGFVLGGGRAGGGGDGGEIDHYRALLEGVAFVERLGYEHLSRLGAPARPPVSVAGAASASRVWNRIRATVLGAPLLEKPGASTALGACILAAAGTLHADLATSAEAMGVRGEPVEPIEDEAEALESSYRRFLAALDERGWLPA